VKHRNSDFEKLICDDLATSCKNLANFGPATPEFKKAWMGVYDDRRVLVKKICYVHPLVDQQFGYAAPLLDLAGISTEFSGAITTQFCFAYTLEGVTSMSCGLHARLCHTFLVLFDCYSFATRQCRRRHYVFRLFRCHFRSFVRSDIATTISDERIERF